MSLNETPSGERLHIGFFGCRNAGKSSLVNAVTGQDLAVVSEVRGTTTDPVTKAMELLPLGPVVIIDTPGFDDEGALGAKRVSRTRRTLAKTDIAVLVVDGTVGVAEPDRELMDIFREKQVPWILVYNKKDQMETGAVEQAGAKSDAMAAAARDSAEQTESAAGSGKTGAPAPADTIAVSALTGENIYELKEMIGRVGRLDKPEKRLVGDLIAPGDLVVLVTPIDESAPKGRMILPQVQAIRDILDAGAMPVVCRETELAITLEKLGTKPAMVVTDSQAFAYVDPIVPQDIPLTSFSILMARYKGFLETAVEGVAAVRSLPEGAPVLIAEGCTHHRQCNDIGTVKIPRMLKQLTGKTIEFNTSSGGDFPADLSPYAMVIHCGACMLNEREVLSRMEKAVEQEIPFTNYGIFIANATGVLERSLRIFPQLHRLVD